MAKYSDKLKSPKWQKKRLELFNLRGFKCEECGCEEKELHIHHRFYIKGRQPWEYDNDVFQVLCDSCHENKHNLNNCLIDLNYIIRLLSVSPEQEEEMFDLMYLLIMISKNDNHKKILSNLAANSHSNDYLNKLCNVS